MRVAYDALESAAASRKFVKVNMTEAESVKECGRLSGKTLRSLETMWQ